MTKRKTKGKELPKELNPPSIRKRRRKMITRTIESYLHQDTIINQVAAFLYASGTVHDNEEVTNIEFGDPNAEGVVPLKVTFTKEVTAADITSTEFPRAKEIIKKEVSELNNGG